MTAKTLKADYLIIGSGALGMAFADTLLDETDANIIIVDRYARPGGHWNVAYPYVTLHQPSDFYGVPSKELSNGTIDSAGLNKGMGHLATGSEIMAYFESVMRDTFLPTGRVQYFPLCDYKGGGRFEHIMTGKAHQVDAAKTVDCTLLNTHVPATHAPNFTVDDSAQFMPLNDLPKITTPPTGYVVIGGGKTGIDACLWLLEQGVEPDDISWIISRDAWLLDRANTQPRLEFLPQSMGAQAAQLESIANATSFEDMYDRLEASGYFVRLDPDVRPTMFHGATISQAELTELRRIKNCVRQGRIAHVGTDAIEFVNGSTISTSPGHVHVDCSASAIKAYDPKPIFEGDLITPQTVRSYQPVFSASLIAHIEALGLPETEKNKLCGVVPLPNSDVDYMYMTRANMMNQYLWGQDKTLRNWITENRLDGFGQTVKSAPKDDPVVADVLNRFRANAMPAMIRLNQLIEEMESPK